MKLCKFEHGGKTHYGVLRGDSIVAYAEISGDPWEIKVGERIATIELSWVRVLPPLSPSKIVCIGRNYKEHAQELGNDVPPEPLIFLKATSALIAHEQQIRRPSISDRVDLEGELGVVIGRTCRKLHTDEDVRPYIFGYTCLNDVTARDLQKKDGQWSRAKSFDTFCPVGPVIETELNPWAGVKVETRVNGEVKQSGSTKDLWFPIDRLLRHISECMTLYPGDIIATGTPAGVGPMRAGDVVEVSVEGVGTLRNPVVND
jgi:2-keto-4-pentenoate hydratase/2-oxohepta-3-ene-1,7-dioic acid hydratase in catechol pathway